jgi:hypothetical protein
LEISVSGTESDDHEAVPRARRRGESVRLGAQVPRTRADAVFGQAALSRGRAAGQSSSGESVPKRADRRGRLRAEPHEITSDSNSSE